MNLAFIPHLLMALILMMSKLSYAQSALEAKTALTVAVNHTSYPYHFTDSQGQVAGIMVDLWKLWAKNQQVDLQFVPLTWQQTITQVRDGAIDIHAGMMQTSDRSRVFNFSAPFFALNNYIRLHHELPKIDAVAELLPYTVGVVEGSSHVEQIKQLHPAIKLRQYQSRFALFDAALAGEVNAFSNLDKLSDNYPRYKELQTQFPAYKQVLFDKAHYVSAVAKDNTELVEIIDAGFAKISQAEKEAIEKKWLGVAKKNDVLSLVFTPEFPPFMALSPSGKPQGLFIDIWRLWAETMGLNVEFIPQSMSDAVEVISQGGADIHIAYPESAITSTHLKVAKQVYSVASNVYVSKALPNISQLSQLKGKKLGVFETAPYKTQIRQLYPEIRLVFFRHSNEMFKAADAGQIDAMVGSVENMQAQLALVNLQTEFYQFEQSPFSTDVYALTQENNSRLAEIIDEGFNLLPIDKLVQLEKRWLSDSRKGFYHMAASQVTLSDKELAFIQQYPEIKVGIHNSWKPVEFLDEQGQAQGINMDINRLITQRTGLKFSYVPFDSWNDMLTGLSAGKVDVVGSATETEARKKYFIFSDTYWDMPWVIIHQRQEGHISQIKDFYGKEIAIIRGYYLINKIRKEHPSINLRLVDNYEEGLLAVKKGVVQGFIENIATASELINRESLVTLNMSVVEEFNVDKNSFAIRKDWPLLKSIINKALLAISESEKQQIYEKWFAINLATGLDKNTVFKLSGQIGLIILAVLIVIIAWNRRLYREINTRKSLEVKMKRMATHDELTGLANRSLLKDRINTAINLHQRQGLQMAVLFIDLDGFKNVNDTYGHDVGDELLVEVAKRLVGCVRKSDTVARFGGDEFIMLLTGLHNKEEASFVADKVLKLVQQPFELSTIEARIGCSIGIAIYPNDGLTDTDLLKQADTLMYQVKAAGKNHYIFG